MPEFRGTAASREQLPRLRNSKEAHPQEAQSELEAEKRLQVRGKVSLSRTLINQNLPVGHLKTTCHLALAVLDPYSLASMRLLESYEVLRMSVGIKEKEIKSGLSAIKDVKISTIANTLFTAGAGLVDFLMPSHHKYTSAP